MSVCNEQASICSLKKAVLINSYKETPYSESPTTIFLLENSKRSFFQRDHSSLSTLCMHMAWYYGMYKRNSHTETRTPRHKPIVNPGGKRKWRTRPPSTTSTTIPCPMTHSYPTTPTTTQPRRDCRWYRQQHQQHQSQHRTLHEYQSWLTPLAQVDSN